MRRSGRLSERERLELLRVFDEVIPAIPVRPIAEVELELAEIRRTRREADRRSARMLRPLSAETEGERR